MDFLAHLVLATGLPGGCGGSAGELLAVAVSDDHKPEKEEERERIEANNGCVYRSDPLAPSFPCCLGCGLYAKSLVHLSLVTCDL